MAFGGESVMSIRQPTNRKIINTPSLTAEIKWNPNFAENQNKKYGLFSPLQNFIDNYVLKGCELYMPFRTGTLTSSGQVMTEIGDGRVRWATPYARFLYYGKLMVDPVTGSAWARSGSTKVVTDIALNFDKSVNALAGPKWFERWKNDKGNELIKDAQDFVKGI